MKLKEYHEQTRKCNIAKKIIIRLDSMIKMRNISRRCIRKYFRLLKYISRCVNLIDGKNAINQSDRKYACNDASR